MTKAIVIKYNDEVEINTEELNIVSLLSYGFTAQKISEKTKLNVRAVEHKIATLKKSLNCKTVTQLCCFCIRYKLIK